MEYALDEAMDDATRRLACNSIYFENGLDLHPTSLEVWREVQSLGARIIALWQMVAELKEATYG